jgi:inosine-uridine nucleoside N-ribohydrolase
MASTLVPPRLRVFVDNDFSGDPDDLYQMAHHLLCPSVKVVGIIGSHLGPGDPFDPSPVSAANAVSRVEELLGVMGLTGSVPVYQGSNVGLADPLTSIRSPAVDALIAEALRDDPLPLFLVCGAGLTDLASALLLEPRIADRMTVVWIGGQEYPDLASPPPGATGPEYNLKIDVTAGISVFNHSRARLWQVPRDAYRQALVTQAELLTRVRPHGTLGRFLYDAIQAVEAMMAAHGRSLGETYVLGDSPLVLLTALQTPFEPSPASSFFVERDTPTLLADGSYGPGTGSRPIRVWTRLDNRLLFEDFFAKLALFAGR